MIGAGFGGAGEAFSCDIFNHAWTNCGRGLRHVMGERWWGSFLQEPP